MLSGVTTSWDKLECLISIVHFIKINNHYLLERKLHRSSEMLIFQVCGNSGNLAHLGKLFEMYIGKSYHRPRSTWLDAVYRYINDSYGHLTRSHVTFLLEVGIYILSDGLSKISQCCVLPHIKSPEISVKFQNMLSFFQQYFYKFIPSFVCCFSPGPRAWSPSLQSSCIGHVVFSDATSGLLISIHEALSEWCTQDNSQVSEGEYPWWWKKTDMTN